jgi:hypothetical protein
VDNRIKKTDLSKGVKKEIYELFKEAQNQKKSLSRNRNIFVVTVHCTRNFHTFSLF